MRDEQPKHIIVDIENLVGDVNIENSIVDIRLAANGFLEVIAKETGSQKRESLLSFLGTLKYDLSLPPEMREKINSIYIRIEKTSPEQADEFFRNSPESNEKYKKYKTELGMLVIGLAIGYATREYYENIRTHGNLTSPNTDSAKYKAPRSNAQKSEEPNRFLSQDMVQSTPFFTIGKAEAYRLFHRYDDALGEINKSLFAHPDLLELFQIRGYLNYQSGNYTAAHVDFCQAAHISLQNNCIPEQDSDLTPVSNDFAHDVIQSAKHSAYSLTSLSNSLSEFVFTHNTFSGLHDVFHLDDLHHLAIGNLIDDIAHDFLHHMGAGLEVAHHLLHDIGIDLPDSHVSDHNHHIGGIGDMTTHHDSDLNIHIHHSH